MVAKSSKSSPSSMHIVQLRTQSFARLVKIPPKLKLRWPHETPIPEDLALAGFYYCPYEGAEDNVCCYLCGKNMGGWEVDDDPLKEHLRGNRSCAWAILRDLLVRSKNGEDLGDTEDPRSQRMNDLREATFGKWWPHDDKKGWNPKSKKMARAGFFYTPNDDSEDMVHCPYCQIGLDGWEPKDDPWEEHKRRTPDCPFFVGFDGSAPPSAASSPVTAHTAPTRGTRRLGGETETVTPKKQQKNKRRLTRQNADDEDEEIFTAVETPPASKRRKSSRVASQPIEVDEPSSQSSSNHVSTDQSTPSRRKSRRASTNPAKRRTSTVKPAPIEILEEDEDPEPTNNRRITRSAQTLPPPDLEVEETIVKKTPVKGKGKHTRTKSRQVSKTATEKEKPDRRKSKQDEPEEEIKTDVDDGGETPVAAPKKKRGRQTKVPIIPDDEVIDVDELPEPVVEPPKPKRRGRQSEVIERPPNEIPDINVDEPVAEPPKPKKRGRQSKVPPTIETLEPSQPDILVDISSLEDEPIPVQKPKRGRPSKVTEPRSTAATPEKPTRKTRQSLIPEETEDSEATPKAIVVPKRKRASTRATRVVSTAVKEMPEIEEVEGESTEARTRSSTGTRSTVPVVEIPELSVPVEPEEEPEPDVEVIAPVRGGKTGRGRGRGRGRSTISRQSAVLEIPTEEVAAPATTAGRGRGRGRGRRTVSKRDISAVYDDTQDEVSPPAKRKASGLRSVEKLPTPSEESSASDVFEDTKSTFSDVEDTQPQRSTKGRQAGRGGSRSKVLSEEAPSTIYHSADDNLSSPAQSSGMGRSKRELVNNAKKELEDEIWRERVANGEIGLAGSSDDDDKENAAEEKGKKPTRTVRGKGAKGAGRKAKGTGKKGKNAPVESEIEETSSAGESHALMIKAMVSPMRPGPVIAELDEETSQDEQLDTYQTQLTPVQSPKRKALSWSPAKIDNISPVPIANGDLTNEEEEMTVEQWMLWVINDEVNRLEEECEKLVRNLEREGERARRLLENLM